jgi:hypothetical protein
VIILVPVGVFLWAPAALWSEICSPHSTEDEWQAMQEPELGPRCYPIEPLVIGGAAGHYFLARSSRFVPGRAFFQFNNCYRLHRAQARSYVEFASHFLSAAY